jgi:hypothetical protein
MCFKKIKSSTWAGDTVQVKNDISQTKSGVRVDPVDGTQFLSLSDYSDVNPIHPAYSGVEMGLIKEKNVAMLFSKVSKRRYQQINKKVLDKAWETLHLAQSVAHNNVRANKYHGTQSIHV